jgi:hypothetical protein
MTSMRRLRLLALAALWLGAGGCDICGLIDQEIIVALGDPDLSGLIADCTGGVQPSAELRCPGRSVVREAGRIITCACLPLCERAYGIVNADPRRPELQGCTVTVGDEVRIEIVYRSVCK